MVRTYSGQLRDSDYMHYDPKPANHLHLQVKPQETKFRSTGGFQSFEIGVKWFLKNKDLDFRCIWIYYDLRWFYGCSDGM